MNGTLISELKKHIIDIITRIISKRGPIEKFVKITHLL